MTYLNIELCQNDQTYTIREDQTLNYIKLRQEYESLLYKGAFLLILLCAILKRDAIVYLVGLFFLLSLAELFFVKCPHCKGKPVSFFRKFPTHCHHCGKDIALPADDSEQKETA